MFSGLIVSYLIILIILYILGKSIWRPLFLIFNILFQGALGASGIYVFNLLLRLLEIQVPLNPFNALFVGYLGLPGLLALLAALYMIKV